MSCSRSIQLNVIGQLCLFSRDISSLSLSYLDLKSKDFGGEFENLVLDFTILEFMLVAVMYYKYDRK